jgi:hypothetical protein
MKAARLRGLASFHFATPLELVLYAPYLLPIHVFIL